MLTWSAGVTATSVFAALPRTATAAPRGGLPARALLLRPCAGSEPSLRRALGSTLAARCSFPLAVRMALASPEDAARAAAEEACGSLVAAGMDARVVFTGAVGPNRKADQLARALAAEPAPPEVVIVADSDVDLAGVSLDDLVAPLGDAGVAASWGAPVEREPRTLADRASAAVLGASLHAFPLLAALDRGALVGKLLAVRRDALEAVGGFGGLVTWLGEDMELGRRLRAEGRGVVFARVVAPSLAHGRSWGDVASRYARWIAVIRSQRPGLLVSYPALLFATAPIVALSLLAAFLGSHAALAGGVLALATRLVVAQVAAGKAGLPRSAWSLVGSACAADALLLVAFSRALASRRTAWRGTRMRTTRRGRLEDEPSG